ncbi:MAG: hypothetical protein ACREI3_03450 [Nitrospirales bacterium]
MAHFLFEVIVQGLAQIPPAVRELGYTVLGFLGAKDAIRHDVMCWIVGSLVWTAVILVAVFFVFTSLI